jgi:hypothetical protein
MTRKDDDIPVAEAVDDEAAVLEAVVVSHSDPRYRKRRRLIVGGVLLSFISILIIVIVLLTSSSSSTSTTADDWTPVGSTLQGQSPNDLLGYDVALSKIQPQRLLLAVGVPNYDSDMARGTGAIQLHAWETTKGVITTTTTTTKTQWVGETAQTFLGTALRFHGSLLVVSAFRSNANAGSVMIYNVSYLEDKTVLNATQLGSTLYGSHEGDQFGFAVDIINNAENDTSIWVVVGAPGYQNHTGLVQVYQYVVGSDWILHGEALVGTTPGAEFGSAVAISGTRLAASARLFDQERGLVQLYEYQNDTAWKLHTTFEGNEQGDSFGRSLGLTDKLLAVGADNFGTDNQGMVRLYDLELQQEPWGSPWLIGEAQDRLGFSLSLKENCCAVGSRWHNAKRGQVTVYAGGSWNQQGSSVTGRGIVGDEFGYAVDMTEDCRFLVVGAPSANVTGAVAGGLVQVYEHDGV